MNTKYTSNLQFTDMGSNDEALIIIRASEEYIALCISKRNDGDIEVFFQPEEGEKLLEALQQAISAARETP